VLILRGDCYMKATLLVTFDPSHAGSAKKQIEDALKEIKKDAKFLKSEAEGIFELQTKDARKLVQDIGKIAKKDIAKLDKTFNWIPIDTWAKATVKDMQKTIKTIQKDIKEKEKWAMDLGKRMTKLHDKDLIIKLTEPVDKPNVDLKKPEKIIKVEIIGNKAGISLLKPDEILNLFKFK